MTIRSLSVLVLLTAAATAQAEEYFSVAENHAILYDAPSTKAARLFVVSRFLPLEQVVNLGDWVKVRDASGSLGWVERRALSTKRYVVVSADSCAIRQAPSVDAATLIRVKQKVALEWLENTGTGWVKVRHRDGASGFLKAAEIWGG